MLTGRAPSWKPTRSHEPGSQERWCWSTTSGVPAKEFLRQRGVERAPYKLKQEGGVLAFKFTDKEEVILSHGSDDFTQVALGSPPLPRL